MPFPLPASTSITTRPCKIPGSSFSPPSYSPFHICLIFTLHTPTQQKTVSLTTHHYHTLWNKGDNITPAKAEQQPDVNAQHTDISFLPLPHINNMNLLVFLHITIQTQQEHFLYNNRIACIFNSATDGNELATNSLTPYKNSLMLILLFTLIATKINLLIKQNFDVTVKFWNQTPCLIASQYPTKN